jgi:TfoX/Sxy family transcriptional regulator of competence genes
MTVDRAKLLSTLRIAAERLPDVDEKKMFGCEALFVKGAIFALVWKTGRIGVKLPDTARFDSLASQKGAEPWKAGPMVMAHWLLVPPAIDADAKKLAPWVKEAHAMAAAGLGATKRKPKKKAAAKTAKNKTAAKR